MNTLKNIIIIVLVGILAISYLIQTPLLPQNEEDYILEEIYSTDGLHKVTIIANGEPIWSFGPHNISISIDDYPTLLKTSVANDGGKANVLYEWVDNNTVKLVLRGKEQKDDIYTISFKEHSYSVEFEIGE